MKAYIFDYFYDDEPMSNFLSSGVVTAGSVILVVAYDRQSYFAYKHMAEVCEKQFPNLPINVTLAEDDMTLDEVLSVLAEHYSWGTSDITVVSAFDGVLASARAQGYNIYGLTTKNKWYNPEELTDQTLVLNLKCDYSIKSFKELIETHKSFLAQEEEVSDDIIEKLETEYSIEIKVLPVDGICDIMDYTNSEVVILSTDEKVLRLFYTSGWNVCLLK